MTLVAAYRSTEGGILLCADREENDGCVKRSVNKIYRIPLLLPILPPPPPPAPSKWPCEFYLAGSGPANAIIKANEEIHNALEHLFASPADVLCEYKTIIEAALLSVHKQFPEELAYMPMNLLIVFQVKAPNAAPLLYYTEKSVVLHADNYAAFGSGKPICDYFSDQLYEHPRFDKRNLMVVAAFIFREAHKSASGVGSDVDMIYTRPGFALCVKEEFGPNLVKEIQAGIPPLSEAVWEYWKAHVRLPSWAEKMPKF